MNKKEKRIIVWLFVAIFFIVSFPTARTYLTNSTVIEETTEYTVTFFWAFMAIIAIILGAKGAGK